MGAVITTICARYEGSVKTSWYPLMFVVKTTSATVVVRLARSAPRNRVPSSRRRNPGTTSRSATLGLLGGGCRRCRRSGLARAGNGGCCGGRRRRQGNARCCTRRRRASHRSGRSSGLREGLVEHRLRRATLRRRDRQNQREEEEESTTPPARLRQQIARLARAKELIGKDAHATEARRQARPLAALQEDGRDEHEAVEDEQDEQEGVHAAEKAEGTSGRLNLKYAVTYRRRSSERESRAGAADRHPAVRFQTRSADQQSVHAGRRKQRGCVPRIHAAAVQNRDLRPCFSRELSQLGTNRLVSGGGVLRRGRPSRPDGPHRLVGDDR